MSGLSEELCKCLGGLDSDGVSSQVNLLDHGRVVLCEVRLDVCPGIKLKTLS